MMDWYVKRPVEVRAIRYDGSNWDQIYHLWPGRIQIRSNPGGKPILVIATKEGQMLCRGGSWIIEGVEGEIYPCDDSIFHKTYFKRGG